MADEISSSNSVASANEDVVAKYKRLLSMARSSLEANQQTLAAKDQQITQLLAMLEEEKSKRQQGKTKEEDPNIFPHRIVRRIDVEDVVWVLLEFDGVHEWKSFHDEQSLDDYVKRVPGVPLQCPQKCLSTEDSTKLIEECKRKIEKVVEEFRRYKVRTEITLKQKEAEIKSSHVHLNENLSAHKVAMLNQGGMSSLNHSNKQEQSSAVGHITADAEEVERLKTTLQEQELKWRSSYEKIAKENELLKAKGAESVVAMQWRARYEHCVRDRDELAHKVNLFSHLSEESVSTQKNVAELYVELHEDYKGLRKRLLEQVQQIKLKHKEQPDWDHTLQGLQGILDFYHVDHSDLDSHKLLSSRAKYSSSSSSSSAAVQLRGSSSFDEEAPSPRYAPISSSSSSAGKGNPGLAESKIQYIRQMVFQYLVCKDPEVKAHIETAIITLFRFSLEEKETIEKIRKEEQQDALSTITNFLGSFAVPATSITSIT